MDIGFEGFETTDLDVEVEEIEVKKVRQYRRIFKAKKGGGFAALSVSGGIVIAVSLDNHIYAFDLSSMKELWRFRTNGSMCDNAPAIDRNLVFVGSFDGNLYSLEKENGRLIWKFKTSGAVNCPANFDETGVYFGSEDGYVYKLDKYSGSLIWRFKTGGPIISYPAIKKGLLFIGSGDGNLYCLNKETGVESWRFKTGGEVVNVNPMLIHNGKIFFGSFDNYLYCLNYLDGSEVWRTRVGSFGIEVSPVIFKDNILIPARDGKLYSLDLNGKEIWRFTGKINFGPPNVEGDKIFIGSEDGNVYCLDQDGKEVWRYVIGKCVFYTVTWNGFIISGSFDCHLYVIGMQSREFINRFDSSLSYHPPLPKIESEFEIGIKKETQIEGALEESKYKKKKEETVSLSDYHVESEYSSESEYKQKSDYDVEWVMFEGIMEDVIWSSLEDSKLNPSGISRRI
ncbi:MAG: PQQ-binding-like beta-propeller repeat protein [Candidatus Aenigmatarchaeota archaeon]|nr:MAG: PQQ-binding-like beta-propeller repeat protein [Candidatus Aenigmarchaeota archaeon]